MIFSAISLQIDSVFVAAIHEMTWPVTRIHLMRLIPKSNGTPRIPTNFRSRYITCVGDFGVSYLMGDRKRGPHRTNARLASCVACLTATRPTRCYRNPSHSLLGCLSGSYLAPMRNKRRRVYFGEYIPANHNQRRIDKNAGIRVSLRPGCIQKSSQVGSAKEFLRMPIAW